MSQSQVPCPVCGHKDAVHFYGYGMERTAKVPVENQVCKQCGLVHRADPPSMDALMEFYARYQEKTVSEAIDVPLFYEESTFDKDRFRADFMSPFIQPGCRILDLGCGIGAQLKVLQDKYGDDISLTGLNPESGPVAYAREKYGVNSLVGMFEDVDFQPGSFDLILMDNVFEHFLDPREQLERMHALLDKGGKLVIFTDNSATLRGFPWQNFFFEHIVTYSPTTLRVQLESTGFDVERIETQGHVTSEGFHWPYISCVAVKTDIPSHYDYAANGENYSHVIQRLNNYTREWYQTNYWAKKLFDLESEGRNNLTTRLMKSVYKALAKVNNQPPHQLPNHTLPPLEYHQRRVVLIHAITPEDDNLGIDLVMKAGLNPDYVVIVENGAGLKIHKATPFIRAKCHNALPSHLKSEEDVWMWLEEIMPNISKRISMDIRNARLDQGQKDDLLASLASGKDLTIFIHDNTCTTNERDIQ